MKKIISLLMSLIMILGIFTVNSTAAYSADKVYAQDKLEEIQKISGFIPGKTAIVTGNCYGFVSKVCEKLYGVEYNGEGLYGNYKCTHSTGNYYTVATLTTSSNAAAEANNIINFFIKYAVPGDVIHYGVLTSGTSNTGTHTFMIQSIDSKKMEIYHSNYETREYGRSTCHIDTIYWDSLRENPTSNVYDSNGHLYSLNAIFHNKMKQGGMGVSINRHSKYTDKFIFVGAAVPQITTTRSSSTSVKVSWDKIQGASKYQVQYKKSTESSYTTASSTVTSTSYDVKNLTLGTTYDFRVRAYISGKWFDYSDAESKKVLPPTITQVTFSNTKDGIKMTWGKRSDITGVNIYRATSADGTYTKIKTVTDNTVSSYTDKSIKYGTEYYYKFERYIKQSSNTYSTKSEAKKAEYRLSVPVISSSRLNSTTLKFTFKGDELRDKFVYYVSDSKGNSVKGSTATTDNYAVISNLTVGEEYTLYCAQRNGMGTSAYGIKSTQALPASTSEIKAEKITSGIKITFKKADDVTGNVVYRSTSKDGTYSKIAVLDTTDLTSYTDKTVKYNTVYYYKIRRFLEKEGKTYYSSYTPATAGVKNTVETVSSVSTLRKSPTAVTVKWKAANNASRYQVQYKLSGGSWKTAGTTASLSYTVTGLTIDKTYYFRVKGYNSIGSGSYSSSVSKKVLPPTPVAPTTKVTSTGTRIYWKNQSYATGYKIYRSKSKSGTYSLIKTVSSNKVSSWTDTSVKYGSGYYYKVVCYVKKSGKTYNSPNSDYAYRKYTLAKPSVTASVKNSTTVTVKYKAVTGASKYTIQYKENGGSWKSVSTDKTSKDITHLKTGKKYYFRVKAVSSVGSGEYSTSVSVQM